MPNKRKVKTNESTRNDYTPVKASNSRSFPCEDSPSPIGLKPPHKPRPNVCEDDVNQDSPEQLLFSPVIKPAQNDVEWAWKSPVGRTHSKSGPASKRRLQGKTPVHKTKRSFQTHSPDSPIANLPSKRKLIKHECEGTEYLSTLTSQLQALTERFDEKLIQGSAVNQTEEANFTTRATTSQMTEEVIVTLGQTIDEAETKSGQTRCEQFPLVVAISTTTTHPTTSLSALLEDDDGFDLFQCSQFIEEKLTENPDKVIFSPININGVSRIGLTRTDKSIPIFIPTNEQSKKSPKACGRPEPILLPNKGEPKKYPAVSKSENIGGYKKHSTTTNRPTPVITNNGSSRKCLTLTEKPTPIPVPISSGPVKCAAVPGRPTSITKNNWKSGASCALPLKLQDDNDSKEHQNLTKSPMLLPKPTVPPQVNFIRPADGFVNHGAVSLLHSSSKSEPIDVNKCVPDKVPCPTPNPELSKCVAVQISSVFTSNQQITGKDNKLKSGIDDDSFDAILLSFCDQNMELLNETAKGSCSAPKLSAVPQTVTSGQSCPVASSAPNKTMSRGNYIKETTVMARCKDTDKKTIIRNEDSLQPELLNILESIESTFAKGTDTSVSLKCTPEEIEKKRAEARLKLQRKKKAMLDGISRLSNPHLKGKLQS